LTYRFDPAEIRTSPRSPSGSDRDIATRGSVQANGPGSLSGLPPRFWLITALTGVSAGIGGIVMMAILRAVQHLAFGYHAGQYSDAAARHGDLRRMTVLVCGGIIAGYWTNCCAPTRAQTRED
jgi:hypothetical protein